MKMLVTGANGAVGSYVEEVFGNKYELHLTDKDDLDVTEWMDCEWVGMLRPDVVLHLAAATDVDQCQRDPTLAWRVNAVGTGNIACNSVRSKFVYVSTAGVFSGEKPTPYSEHDVALPTNEYGRSKLEGERLVQRFHPDHLIVRSGWMFGGGDGLDKKFVGKIQNQIAAGYSEIFAVDDKVGSPTYAKDLLGLIDRLLDEGERGVFHGCNEGVASRWEVAQAIVDLTGAQVEVIPCKSSVFKLDAPRARSEAMESRRLGVPQRPWRDALAEYLSG